MWDFDKPKDVRFGKDNDGNPQVSFIDSKDNEPRTLTFINPCEPTLIGGRQRKKVGWNELQEKLSDSQVDYISIRPPIKNEKVKAIQTNGFYTVSISLLCGTVIYIPRCDNILGLPEKKV